MPQSCDFPLNDWRCLGNHTDVVQNLGLNIRAIIAFHPLVIEGMEGLMLIPD